MTREEHEKIMAAKVEAARADGYAGGYAAGVEAGLHDKVMDVDSTLGALIEELIHKRDVLGLDIGDPLELMREAYRHG